MSAARRETPFPKRSSTHIVSKTTPQFVRRAAVATALRFEPSDSDVRDLRTPRLDDEIIVIHDSSSSSCNDSNDLSTSMATISLLDSSSSSGTSLNETFRVQTISPVTKLCTVPRSSLTAKQASKTPPTSYIPRSSGYGMAKPPPKPRTPLTAATRAIGISDVLRLYRTQACTELGRLQANVATWQLLNDSGTLSSDGDARRRTAIAEAIALLAGRGRQFQQAVNASLAGPCDNNCEAIITKQWNALKADLALVMEKFASLPIKRQTPVCSPRAGARQHVLKIPRLLGLSGESATAKGLTMTGGALLTPSPAGTTNAMFQAAAGRSEEQTPVRSRRRPAVAAGQTPNSARSKIPV